jgi:hypothetical protein
MVTVSQSSDLEATLTNIKSQVMPQFNRISRQQPGTTENRIVAALGRFRQATVSTVMAAGCCTSEKAQFKCPNWVILGNNCKLQGNPARNHLGAPGQVRQGTLATIAKSCSTNTSEETHTNTSEQTQPEDNHCRRILGRVRRGTSAIMTKCCSATSEEETQWERFDHSAALTESRQQKGRGCTLASAIKGVPDCVSRGASAVMAACRSASTSKEARDGTKLDQLKKDLMEHLEEKRYIMRMQSLLLL